MAHDARGVLARIQRVHVESLHERGCVEVERRRLPVVAAELAQEAEESARTVRRAAVGVHEAVVHAVPAVSGERRIRGELAAVRTESAKIDVVEGALDLVGPLRVVRRAEELLAEAHPRRRHARFLEPPVRKVLLSRPVEPRLGTRAAPSEVDLLLHDVLRRLHCRV